MQVNQSPVENFANTHKKNGVFVSEKAKAAYVSQNLNQQRELMFVSDNLCFYCNIILQLEMERLRASTVESDGESLMSEREIIKKSTWK